MNLHDKAVQLVNRKIALNPRMYQAYSDPSLYEMLIKECEEQLMFSSLTVQINELKEMDYAQGVI